MKESLAEPAEPAEKRLKNLCELCVLCESQLQSAVADLRLQNRRRTQLYAFAVEQPANVGKSCPQHRMLRMRRHLREHIKQLAAKIDRCR